MRPVARTRTVSGSKTNWRKQGVLRMPQIARLVVAGNQTPAPTKPGDLRLELPAHFQLTANSETAYKLSVTILDATSCTQTKRSDEARRRARFERPGAPPPVPKVFYCPFRRRRPPAPR